MTNKKVLVANSSDDWDNVQALPMDILYPFVDIDYYYDTNVWNKAYQKKYKAVLSSIKNNGLKHPIVVGYITKDEWLELAERTRNSLGVTKEEILDPPLQETEAKGSKILQIRCGTKRYHMAKKLGYTHIDCIVLEHYGGSSKYCKQMNREWKQNKGKF